MSAMFCQKKTGNKLSLRIVAALLKSFLLLKMDDLDYLAGLVFTRKYPDVV